MTIYLRILTVVKGNDSSTQITSINISNLTQNKKCNRLCTSPLKKKHRNHKSIETSLINSLSHTFPDYSKGKTLENISEN